MFTGISIKKNKKRKKERENERKRERERERKGEKKKERKKEKRRKLHHASVKFYKPTTMRLIHVNDMR